jgi:hypothetical protein
MNLPTAPRSIDQYLRQLREALAGQDPALLQDALYDAEEYRHLRRPRPMCWNTLPVLTARPKK